jgi:hypothetical protein
MKSKRILLSSIILVLFLISGTKTIAQEKKVEVLPLKQSTGWSKATPRGVAEGVWTVSEGKSTRLILKKYFETESVSKESEFEVEKDQRRFKVTITGWCKSGEIHVTILRPSKKVYKAITIDTSAEVEWSQSVRFTDEDTDYVGEWIIQIVAKEADGSYNVVLSAD